MAESFDPNRYLAKKGVPVNKEQAGFNPDQYLVEKTGGAGQYDKSNALLQGAQQSLTFGYTPEIQAGIEPAMQKVYEMLTGQKLDAPESYEKRLSGYRQRDVAIKEENPWTYTAGQLGGAVMPGGLMAKGALGTAKLGTKLARATGVGAATGAAYNPHTDEVGGNTDIMVDKRIDNGLIGGALGLVGQGLISSAQGLKKLVPRAVKVLMTPDSSPAMKNAAGTIVEASGEVPGLTRVKPNAAEIQKASQILGIKPTGGMLNDSTVVQGLESSLEQSPSFAGKVVRGETSAVRDGLRKAATEVTGDAASISNFEAGQQLKSGMMANIGEKLDPHIAAFDDLRNYTKDIQLDPKANERIAKSILKMNEVKLTNGTPLAAEAEKWANVVKNAKSTEDVTMLRKMVGNDLRAAQVQRDGNRVTVLGNIYDKLTKLEENSIKRGAITSSRTGPEGNSIAKEMIGQMRTAKKGYATVANDLKDFSQVAGFRGTKNPRHFVESLDAMRSEDLLKKLSNTQDVRMLTTLKEKMPEQFNLVRQKKLADIVEKSLVKGKVDLGAFLRNTKALGPEAKELLFGNKEAVAKYDAIKTVFESRPDMMGPSGTPQGLQFQQMLNPVMQAQEYARLKLYRFLQTPEGQQKVRDMLMNLDKGEGPVTKMLTKPGLLGSTVEKSRR